MTMDPTVVSTEKARTERGRRKYFPNDERVSNIRKSESVAGGSTTPFRSTSTERRMERGRRRLSRDCLHRRIFSMANHSSSLPSLPPRHPICISTPPSPLRPTTLLLPTSSNL